MNGSQVVHLWAQQSPAKTKAKAGNIFFEGPTIFSYGRHFPMASFVKGKKKGSVAVVVTTREYSTSTSKHVSMVRNSIPSSRMPVFFAPDIPPAAWSKDGPLEFKQQHARAAYDAYLERAAANFAKAKRARTNGSYYLDCAKKQLRDALALAAFFGLRVKPFDPETYCAADIIARIEKQRAADVVAERKRIREAQAKAKDKFVQWQHGDTVRCPYEFREDENGSAYLRAMGEQVETSQGAFVPLNHARRLFHFVKLCRMTGREFVANGTRVGVGHFQVERITPEGNATIRCHFFTWERISEFADKVGWSDDPASDEATAKKEEVPA